MAKLDEGDQKEEAQNQELPEKTPRDSSKRKRTFRAVVKTVNEPTMRRVDRFISEYDDFDGLPSRDENWRRERLLKKPIVCDDNIEKSTKKKEGRRARNGIMIRERLLTKSLESSDESDDEEFYNVVKNIEEGASTSGVFPRQRSQEKSSESRKDGKFGKVKISKNNKKKKREEDGVADDGLKKQRKNKVVDSGPSPPPDLSMEVKNLIIQKANERGGPHNIQGEILLIQKPLSESDIARQQNRFSVPVNMLKNRFLTNEEQAYLETKPKPKKTNYMTVDIIEPSRQVNVVPLRLWNVGNSGKSYVLNGGWRKIVASNRLRQGDVVQLWAVRINGRLCLVFVILAKEEGNTS